MTKGGRFLPGHDARLKSRLTKEASTGSEEDRAAAWEQLEVLGWADIVRERVYAVPAPKTNKPEKQQATPAREIPPAVRVFRENTERYPPKPWWAYLDECIGRDKKNLVRWGEVVFRYVGCGWNTTNVNNMLRFYLNNQLPGDGYAAANGEHKNGNGQKKKEVVTV
jgi:hypothetical protein